MGKNVPDWPYLSKAFGDVISHAITPQNVFELIVKTDFYQVENKQCSQKEIGVMYIEIAIKALTS